MAGGCPFLANFRVAGVEILQRMLTHSSRTTSWPCPGGMVLGSRRWERGGGRRGRGSRSGRGE